MSKTYILVLIILLIHIDKHSVSAQSPFRAPQEARVYVSNSGSQLDPGETVTMIDVETMDVTRVIPVGLRPEGLAISPDRSFLYVANNDDDTLSVIPTAINFSVKTIAVGDEPLGVACSPDGDFIYVVCKQQTPSSIPGEVYVIDAASLEVVSVITVGNNPDFGIAVTDSGRYMGVTNYMDGTLSIVDLGLEQVIRTLSVGEKPFGIWLLHGERYAYVSNFFDVEGDSLHILDTYSLKMIGFESTRPGPVDLAFGPDGIYAYITCYIDSSVTRLDIIGGGSARMDSGVFAGPTGAGIVQTTSGSFLFVANYDSSTHGIYPGDVAAVNLEDNSVNYITVGRSPNRIAAMDAVGSRPKALLSASNSAGGGSMPSMSWDIDFGGARNRADILLGLRARGGNIYAFNRSLRRLTPVGSTPQIGSVPRLARDFDLISGSTGSISVNLSGSLKSGLYVFIAGFLEPGTNSLFHLVQSNIINI